MKQNRIRLTGGTPNCAPPKSLDLRGASSGEQLSTEPGYDRIPAGLLVRAPAAPLGALESYLPSGVARLVIRASKPLMSTVAGALGAIARVAV